MDWVVDQLTKASAGDQQTSAEIMEVQNLQQRLETAEQAQKDLSEHWNAIIQNCKAKASESRQCVVERHQAEILAFEEAWSRPEAMLPFSKPSSKLLQIRKMQKSLALSRNFAEAKSLKQQAEQLQREESQAAEKRATQAMKLEYQQLMESHQRELECEELNWTRKLTVLETERDKAIAANEKLQKQLTARV